MRVRLPAVAPSPARAARQIVTKSLPAWGGRGANSQPRASTSRYFFRTRLTSVSIASREFGEITIANWLPLPSRSSTAEAGRP
jgi:hypothetical protein